MKGETEGRIFFFITLFPYVVNEGQRFRHETGKENGKAIPVSEVSRPLSELKQPLVSVEKDLTWGKGCPYSFSAP